MNALTIGMDKPFIVLNTGLLELLDAEEQRFVIGARRAHRHVGGCRAHCADAVDAPRWLFGRTLRGGRVPLITRIVEGLYQQAGMPMTPALYRYTRQLTLAWSVMLALLALINLLLALCAVPGGVLAQLGHEPPFAVSNAQWSFFANILNYGIVGGFFVIEYLLRKRRFPNRPYRNVLEFGQQMARLGPGFWNELMR